MRRTGFERRRARVGLLFCLPFLLGFIMFFALPMVESVIYAFSTIKLEENGIALTFVGLKNFREGLFADPRFVRTIIESARDMLIDVPLVLLFSMFIALLLNQKFRGRALARAVFFLPVITISGITLQILRQDYLSTAILSGGMSAGGYRGFSAVEFLSSLGFPQVALEGLVPVIQDVFELVWLSGVQILIFLAGLQTVPASMYEYASLEGASAWEKFWKITLPLISPMVLMNVVYSVVDYFTTSTNPVIQMIGEQASNMRFEYAAGLSWMYLFVVMLILGAVYLGLNKRMTYVGE